MRYDFIKYIRESFIKCSDDKKDNQISIVQNNQVSILKNIPVELTPEKEK